MEKENKEILISLQTEKAKRFLSQADEMVELKRYPI